MSPQMGDINEMQSTARVDKSVSLSQDCKQSCRICFCGKSRGRLVSVCNCKGSLAAVHRKCQQKWLQIKRTDRCELCNTQLNVQRVHKDFKDWIRRKNSTNRWYLLLDVMCALTVVPIIGFSVRYPIIGSLLNSTSMFISSALFVSMALLIGMTGLWTLVCIDHHCHAYFKWRSSRFKYILILTNTKTLNIDGTVGKPVGLSTRVLSYFHLTSSQQPIHWV